MAEERAKVAFYYNPENNPNEASFPGVPLGNVLQEQYDALPAWVQKSIEASPMYRKTPLPKNKPAPAPTNTPAPEEDEEEDEDEAQEDEPIDEGASPEPPAEGEGE